MAVEGVGPLSSTHSNLALLELRLRRLEFLLTGSSSLDGIPDSLHAPERGDDTVTTKLASLQRSLERLRRLDGSAGCVVKEVEAIYAKFPELLFSSSPTNVNELQSQAAVVLSHATLFPETASRLSSLQSLQIPRAEQSTKLSELKTEIERCRQDQKELEQQMQDLRQRSGQCLEWWVKVGVVGMGDLWEEWEDRMKQIERQVAKYERTRTEREGYI